MATKKQQQSDDQGGVPVKTESRAATRHPDGVPVQVPDTTTTETATQTATKKGS